MQKFIISALASLALLLSTYTLSRPTPQNKTQEKGQLDQVGR